MQIKKYDILLFDLDGTIMDSGDGIMKCAQYALGKMGIHIEDYRTLRAFVGPPLEDSFKDFYGFTTERAHEAVMAYRERYFDKGLYEQTPYDGVTELLQELKQRGHIIALATSKMQKQANWVIRQFNLGSYIDNVFARDDEGLLHTKADVINSALKNLKIEDRNRVLMIGDRKFDIIGAKECGIDSAGVLWGYGDREEFEKAGANFVCNDYNELLNILGI